MEKGVVELLAIPNIGVILCRLPENPFGLIATSCALPWLVKISITRKKAKLLNTPLLTVDNILVINQIYKNLSSFQKLADFAN
jgi:hypothetical protein